MNLDQPSLNLVRVLDHHDGIALRRHHAARGDTDSFPRCDWPRGFLSHLHDAGKLQISRQALTRAECVLRLYGIAIHGRAMKVRQIDGGVKILGQDTASRPDRRNPLRRHRRNLKQQPQRFLRRDDSEKGLDHLEMPAG